jgi:integrase
MRRGEVLGLRWRDVDLDAARLSVRQQLVRSRAAITFGPPKTKSGRRLISLDPGTVAVLRSHRAAQTAERLQWGEAYKRRGEILGLRWRDVALDAPRLTVRQQLIRQGPAITFGPPKTDKGGRESTLMPVRSRSCEAIGPSGQQSASSGAKPTRISA